VYDIIYNPPETRLLREARCRGQSTLSGVEMFVAQAAAQFALFTGRQAPVDLMRRVALEALGEDPRAAAGLPPQKPRPRRGKRD